MCWQRSLWKIRSKDDIRENIMPYNDECGESDTNIYDIHKLRIPIGSVVMRRSDFTKSERRIDDDIFTITSKGEQLDRSKQSLQHLRLLRDELNRSPFDTIRVYAHEGTGSLAGSLSSLDSFG